MKQILFLYDDRVKVTNEISSIVNVGSYGNIYYKNSTLANNIQKIIEQFDKITFIRINNSDEIKKLEESFETKLVIHFSANFSIINLKQFSILIKKIVYMQENIFLYLDEKSDDVILLQENNSKLFYKKIKDLDFLYSYKGDEHRSIAIDNNHTLISLAHTTNFLYFFTGSFETRHFNSVQGDQYQLVKSSTDSNKIELEYNFYYLLPEAFRFWFVQPFNLKKNLTDSSYEMERYNIPNMALQWIHNSFKQYQFKNFLAKYLTFIEQKPQKIVNKETYIKHIQKNYLGKVDKRIEMFKEQGVFKQINLLICGLTPYDGIDSIIDEYKIYYQNAEQKLLQSSNDDYTLSITHGDTCFSNILYDKRSEMLKLIDPKGANTEDDLYTDSYYDISKLSHSILGNYDYINNEIYDIHIDKMLEAKLLIKAAFNEQNKHIFIDRLVLIGLDPSIVRTFECSLFLSMLPLHNDRIENVFAFILTAINILDELKNNKEAQ